MLAFFDDRLIDCTWPEPACFLKALQSGRGIFETIRVKNNSPEYLDLHLRRLKKGAGFIGITVPRKNYLFLTEKLIRKNSLVGKLSRLKIILFPGSGKTTGHFCITAEPYIPPDRNSYASGVKLLTGRHPLCDCEIARIKSICRLPYAKMKEEAGLKECFDCLLAGSRGEVLETTTGNVLVWDGKRFLIPPADSSRLHGIMESLAVKELRKKGVEVVEKEVRIKHLNSRWGMLVTNSLIGILPVASVGNTSLKNIAEEPGIGRLMAKFSPY